MTSDIRNNFTHWRRGPGTARDPETLRGHLPNGALGGRVVTPAPDMVMASRAGTGSRACRISV